MLLNIQTHTGWVLIGDARFTVTTSELYMPRILSLLNHTDGIAMTKVSSTMDNQNQDANLRIHTGRA
jgi:hypothetical protein